jgi:hypothetical protein
VATPLGLAERLGTSSTAASAPSNGMSLEVAYAMCSNLDDAVAQARRECAASRPARDVQAIKEELVTETTLMVQHVFIDWRERTTVLAAYVEAWRAIVMAFEFITELHVPLPAPACYRPGCAHASPRMCARCGAASYCSRECQVAHWPTHRARCTSTVAHNANITAILKQWAIFGALYRDLVGSASS